jgi:hypothetical protein
LLELHKNEGTKPAERTKTVVEEVLEQKPESPTRSFSISSSLCEEEGIHFSFSFNQKPNTTLLTWGNPS